MHTYIKVENEYQIRQIMSQLQVDDSSVLVTATDLRLPSGYRNYALKHHESWEKHH